MWYVLLSKALPGMQDHVFVFPDERLANKFADALADKFVEADFDLDVRPVGKPWEVFPGWQ